MNLSHNPSLGIQTYTFISQFIEDQSSQLNSLSLEGNKMGNEAFVILASAICYNSSIKVLNVSDNNISDSSMKVCAEMVNMASHL